MFFLMMWSNGYPGGEPSVSNPLDGETFLAEHPEPGSQTDPWCTYSHGDIGDAWYSSRWQCFP